MPRKIIHCDADCFFAAVEMRDNPSLKNKPLAIGGSSYERGVIATCNYPARAFGIHSAMSSAKAMLLCPNLVFLPVDMKKYNEVSLQMREIFSHHTEIIEPLSLDEAYLDVSMAKSFKGSATLIAQSIQKQIHQELGITVSLGISTSKFLAKIASDWLKPNGIFVVEEAFVDSFVSQLEVKKIPGVGKVHAAKLAAMGIVTCVDLRACGLLELSKNFGVFGKRLFELSYGIDENEVRTFRPKKSLSVEQTFSKDLKAMECLIQLPILLEKLKFRLNSLKESYQIAGVKVKVKFSDFTVTTIERASSQVDTAMYETLLYEALERKNYPVRLLGFGVRFQLKEESEGQLDLFNFR